SKPVRLVKSHYFSGFGGVQGGTTVAGRTYDVSPDGRRFLMFKDVPHDESTPAGFVVIVNWSEELKRLVPTKGCHFLPPPASDRTKSPPRSVPAAWGKSTARRIPTSVGTSRSKSCPRLSHRIRSGLPGLNAKRRLSPR